MVIKLWNKDMPRKYDDLGKILSSKAREYSFLANSNINDNNLTYAAQHGLIHSIFREAAGACHFCNRESYIEYIENWMQEILSEVHLFKTHGATRLFEDSVLTYHCLNFVLSCVQSVVDS